MIDESFLLLLGPYPVFGSFGTTVADELLPRTDGLLLGTGGLLLEDAAVRHADPVIVLLSNVTAPVCAKARPFKLAPVPKLIEVRARMLPINDVFVPRLAELATFHQTLHDEPTPSRNCTVGLPNSLADVLRVLNAARKIQTASGLP